jgi:PAS domain S-box-containing protein
LFRFPRNEIQYLYTMKRKSQSEDPGYTIRKLPEDQSSVLAFALKSISECVSITDMEDKIIFINESFIKTYGYNEAELLDKPISMVRSPNNSQEIVREILPATKRGGWRGELMNRRKDGSDFPVSLTTSIIYNDSGQEIAIMGIASDITERKKVEEALRESERYARALLDALPDLMFRLDRTGLYLDFKAGLEDLYFQSESIIGKRNRDITPPEFSDLIESKIRSTLENGVMEVFEYKLPISNRGMCDFEARMVASGPDEVTAISRDITERKKADEALQKKIKELEYFNNLMINRELKMIELKKEINSLLNKLGEKDKYIIHELSDIG